MGFLICNGAEYEFDDRVLAHLKYAIGQKLRRHECFFLNWTKPAKEGDGRISVWLSPYSSISMKFSGGRSPELNPVWLKVLEGLAGTARGMTVVSEDQAEHYAKEHPEIAANH